ncbi:MAG: hypothetical protein R3C05_08620 [Pirellulaceae bacterium]
MSSNRLLLDDEPNSALLANFMIDTLNPLNPKWDAAFSGTLDAFGFNSRSGWRWLRSAI